MSSNPRHGTAKSPSGMGRKTQSSAQFSGWRSGSFTDLLSAKMGARQRSNSTPDLRESAAEQKRLYEELPFQALPGMRTKSLTRVKSLASMRRNESFMGRMRGDSVVSTGIQGTENEPLLQDTLAKIEEPGFTGPLLASCILALMSTFINGYNTGVINAAEAVVFPGHSKMEWSIVVSIFCAGAPFGATLAGMCADNFGRKKTLLFNSLLHIVAALIMVFAPNIFVLMVGRILIGFTCGVGTMLVSLYLAELAPPNLRGTLGTCNQFSCVVGILVSNLLSFPLATADRWRFLLGATMVPTALQLLLSPMLRESPRWLLMKNQKEAARDILQDLRQVDQQEADVEIDLVLAASQAHGKTTSLGFFYVLNDASMRLPLLVAVFLQVAQQLSGINAVFYYSNSFFSGMHLSNPLLGTTIVGSVNVISTGIAIFLMDTAGRRPLLLIGTTGMFVSLVLTTCALLGYMPAAVSPMLALVGVNLYVFFFEIGLGPIPWLIVAEMFPARTRATAVSIATNVNWLCNFLVGIVFPVMNSSLGGYVMTPFAGVCLIVVTFVFFFVVETKGKSLEEIQEELKRK